MLGNGENENVYHVVSRVYGRNRLFAEEEKEFIEKLIFKQCEFSGMHLLGWCLMSNHFHLILEVPNQKKALVGMSADELLARFSILRKEYSAGLVLKKIEECRDGGDMEELAKIVKFLKTRLFDLSAFMKELKLKITLFYNSFNGCRGTLWEGPFKSVVVEPGEALRVMAAYVDLNPVRAGLVAHPGEYRWSSFGAAERGQKRARRGLARAVTGDFSSRWSKTKKMYAHLLWGKERELNDVGRQKGKGEGDVLPYSREEIQAIMEIPGMKGRLPLPAVLRCRVRYFTDGVAIGGEDFVNSFFEGKREGFGVRRTSGSRKMLVGKWGELRSLRDLKMRAVTLPVLD